MRHTFAVAALLTVLSANAAQAGDTAALNILGFSAEGNIFAFEEYGAQDGSGFPYANRFYIDVSTDKFMPGTPVRVRLEEESASIKTAREQAARQGQAIAADEILITNRGYLAAFNAVTEESADPYTNSCQSKADLPAGRQIRRVPARGNHGARAGVVQGLR